MVTIELINTANEKYYFNRPLVAVLVGGNSGIGEYTAHALTNIYARCQRKEKVSPALRIYIVGRNQTTAEDVIAGCSRLYPSSQFEFVQAEDLASIKDVDRVATIITRIEQGKYANDQPMIDLLMMTQGQTLFGERIDTAEGLDRTMSLIYYSRIRFVMALMPLLLASSPSPARVISVYGAGLETKFFHEDISLRNPKNYGIINVRSHNTHMTTMAFEHISKQYPGRMSLVHTFPGVVITPAYADSNHPSWFKIVWKLTGAIISKAAAISPADNGARMAYLATAHFPAAGEEFQLQSPESASNAGRNVSDAAIGTDGVQGSGAYAVNQHSAVVRSHGKADYTKLRREGFEAEIWDHTLKVYDDIENKGAFRG